jgi:hypothetical protein
VRVRIYLYAALAALVVPLWAALLLMDGSFGIDFFPLYFAAARVREGLSPYGAEATAALSRVWGAPFAEAGVAYPLPLLLLIIPMTALPYAVVWSAVGGAGALPAIRLSPAWRPLILLPLLFMPFHRSVALGQATLLWFGLAAIMIAGVESRRPWVVGLTCALLVLKPQNGLIFAAAGLVWALVAERRAIWWCAGASLALWGGSMLLQPSWAQEWIAQIQRYQGVVAPQSLLPSGLLLILACWRLPWWGRVAAAQVIIFPLSDLYSALPLLLCWVAVGGPLALAGASVSWLWSILGLPNNTDVLWWLLLWPLILAGGWRGWAQPALAARAARAARLTAPVE